MAVAFRAAGTFASGTASVTPGLPTGHTTNDILLLVCQSANEAITAPAGYTELLAGANQAAQGSGTGAASGSVCVAIFWKRDGGSESAPTVADSGNHTIAVLLAFSGVTTVTSVNWWSDIQLTVATTSTSVTLPAVTTKNANEMIVNIIGHAISGNGIAKVSAETNANLTSITEQVDNTTNSGVGGGLCIVTGIKAAIGGTGTMTATLAATSVQVNISLTLTANSNYTNAPAATTTPTSSFGHAIATQKTSSQSAVATTQHSIAKILLSGTNSAASIVYGLQYALSAQGTATATLSNVKQVLKLLSGGENLLLRTDTISSSIGVSWGENNSTLTGGQTDWQGGSTAIRFTPNAVSASDFGFYQGTTVTPGSVVTGSIYCKANGYNFASLNPNYENTTHGVCTFDLSSGTLVTQGAGVLSSAITNVGGGWYRISSTVVADQGNGGNIGFAVSNTAANAYFGTWTPDGASGMYFAGPQLEHAAAPGPYLAQGSTRTGVFVPIAAMSRAVALIRRGSSSPIGALTRAATRLLTGSVSPAAVLAKLIPRAYQGASSPGTSIQKQTGKTGSATTSPVISFLRAIGLVKQAASSPLAADARQSGKGLQATTTPTKIIAHSVGKAAQSATAPVSSRAMNVARGFQASTSPAATMVKALARVLQSSTSPLVSVLKGAVKLLSVNTSPSATQSTSGQATPVSAQASSSPAATIKRDVAISPRASTAPVGVLSRSVTKLLQAVTAPLTSFLHALTVGRQASTSPVGSMQRAIRKLIGQTTNYVRNSTMVGVAAGDLGGGGSLPTHWGTGGGDTGLTNTVVGSGTESDLPYIDIRVHGTVTATGNHRIHWEGDSNTAVPAMNNQNTTWSVYTRITAGSVANITTFAFCMGAVDATGAGLTSWNLPWAGPPTTNFERQAQTWAPQFSTVTNFTVNGMLMLVQIGAVIDITLRLYAPQIEFGPAATAFVPTSGTSAYGTSLLANQTVSMIKTLGVMRAAQTQPAGTLSRALSRTFQAITSPAAAMAKLMPHSYQALAQVVLTARRDVAKAAVSISVAQITVMTGAVARSVQVITSPIASGTRQLGHACMAAVNSVGMLAHAVGKSLQASVATVSVLAKRAAVNRGASSGVVAALTRGVSRRFSAASASTASGSHIQQRKLQAIASASASMRRTISKVVPVSLVTVATLRRGISAKRSVAVSTVTSWRFFRFDRRFIKRLTGAVSRSKLAARVARISLVGKWSGAKLKGKP